MIENAREWSTSEERFVHPYQFELEHFEPTEDQMQLREPQVCSTIILEFNFCIYPCIQFRIDDCTYIKVTLYHRVGSLESALCNKKET